MTLSTRWTPRDGFVRVMLDPSYTLEASPSARATVRNVRADRWIVEFEGEGFFELSAIRTGRVAASAWVRVCDDGPRLELTDPQEGAFVATTPGRVGSVRGTVIDPLGEPLTLVSEGRQQPLDRSGSFALAMLFEAGINTPDLRVIDKAGNTIEFVRSFLVARSFGTESSRAALWLADNEIDEIEGLVNRRLPDLIEIEGAGLVGSQLGLDFYFDGATLAGQAGNPGSMRIDVGHTGSGQLHVAFTTQGESIGDIRVDNNGTIHPGTVTVVDGSVEFDLAFIGSGANITPVVTNPVFDDDGLDVEVDWMPDWIFNLARDTIRESIAESVQEKVPPILRDMLASVGGTTETDSSDRLGVTRLTYLLDDIDPDLAGISLNVASLVEVLGTSGTDPGPPRFSSAMTVSPGSRDVRLFLPYDLFNQWLHGQWRTGHLSWSWTEADLQDVIDEVEGLQGLNAQVDVSVSTELPPFAGGGQDNVLEISAGQVIVAILLSTDLFHVSLTGRAAMDIDATLEMNGGVAVVSVALRALEIEIENAGLSGLHTDVVEALVERMAPEIAEKYADTATNLDIPDFDLDDIGLPGVTLCPFLYQATVTSEGVVLYGGLELVSP